MTWGIHTGDARTVLPTIGAESVDCIVTSPPYWGLRDYGAGGQIGLEVSPAEYVTELVKVFRECRRVLKPTGTLWVNLGDTYVAGRNGGAGPRSAVTSQRNHDAARAAWLAQGGTTHRNVPGLKPKDLIGVPWRVAFALQEDGWWLRSDIIWAKPSPMPESVRDRPTRSHEYVFLLSRSRRYFYDAGAVAEPVTGGSHPRGTGLNPKASVDASGSRQNSSFSAAVAGLVEQRNARSVWTIAQEPFTGAHFATFPRRLARTCILAGCPVGGVVLDPFAGAGTTGVVAVSEGRSFIGIEINPEYAHMGTKRVVAALANAGQATAEDADLSGEPTQLGMFKETA